MWAIFFILRGNKYLFNHLFKDICILYFSTSYDEHLFELVLPRSCAVGHVDVKFSVHPMCTSLPNIQVTLLKQNITNIGRHIGGNPSSHAGENHSSRTASNPSSAPVDTTINFNIPNAKLITMETDAAVDIKEKQDPPPGGAGMQSAPVPASASAASTSLAPAPSSGSSVIYSQSSTASTTNNVLNSTAPSTKHQPSSSAASTQLPSSTSSSSSSSAANPSAVKMSVINNVLEPGFLKRYAAEILCGPVELAANVDLSGHSGVITLSSAHLLKVRTRSFLVHIKALHDGSQDDPSKKVPY